MRTRSRTEALFIRLLPPALLLIALAAAAAQPAGKTDAGPAPVAQGGHGWMVIPRDAESTAVLHLPPRAGPQGAVSPFGTVRLARRLVLAPEARGCGWGGERGERLYLAFPPERSAGQVQRRVLTIAARPSFGGAWAYDPPERPGALPSLPGDADLQDFVGTRRAPVALLHDRDPGVGTWSLRVLVDSRWEEAPLPWSGERQQATPPAPGSTCHLVSTGDGVGVLVKPPSGAEGTLWLGEFEAGPSLTTATAHLRWTAQQRAIGSRADGSRRLSEEVFWVDGQLIGVAPEDGSLVVSALRTAEVFKLNTITGIGPLYRIAPLSGSGALVILTSSEPASQPAPSSAPPPPPGTPTYRIVELSVHTGRVLYDGAARQGGPVTMRELQLLSALLVIVMIGVVVFIVRPEGDTDTEAHRLIPAGYELADAPRRMLATVLDFAAALPIVMLMFRLRPGDVTDADFLLFSERSWKLVASLIGVVWLHATLGEALLGGSIGKLLAECRVISLAGDPPDTARPPPDGPEGRPPQVAQLRRPTLPQAALRNLIKWVPPLQLAILFGPRGRHLADRLARTAVITRSSPARTG